MDLASGSILVLYFGLKGAAYSLWCALGVRRFRPEHPRRARFALALGLLRLAFGLVFGVAIFLGGALVYAGLAEGGAFEPTVAMGLTYLAVYVPVRWIEWGLIEVILSPRARGLAGFLLGADGDARRWRSGGVLISCLADVPLMLSVGGLPIGRFMC